MYVASLGKKEYVTITEISEKLDISFHFLTKVLQQLTEKKIMISYRGPTGGVALARPAKDIRLIEIVDAIDGSHLFESCIFGLPGCGNQTPCPLHTEWARIRERIQDMFQSTTLAALATKINTLNSRITNDDVITALTPKDLKP